VIPLSESEAAAVWLVLVDHAGASREPFDKENFVHHQTRNVELEWRFGGLLGSGGKFRRNRVWIGDTRTESWTVDCYAEDLTPARQAVIDETNEALAELRREHAR
jgi:hypothetical protein